VYNVLKTLYKKGPTPYDMRCWRFNDLEDARAFILEQWEDHLNGFLAVPGKYVDMDRSFHEDDRAIVQVLDGDRHEWLLTRG